MHERTIKRVLVTGGAGFIGSAACRALARASVAVLNVDKLTYAANLSSLADISGLPNYRFAECDIAEPQALGPLVDQFQPDAIMHFAAETHVDRSIEASDVFIRTNVVGTHVLLSAARAYWERLSSDARAQFVMLHVSTDEVFGALSAEGAFSETTAYNPQSPYAASKAASDHLVRAWGATYGLPIVVGNCTNNYGPYQFPEKLIPLTIINASEFKPIAVYGDGGNVRDWLHVEDHVDALRLMLRRAAAGSTYMIGGQSERTNLHVVQSICDMLDEMAPGETMRRDLICFVEDRPGHDWRYAADISRITAELGWSPSRTFEQGLRDTVRWYLDRGDWWRPIRENRYAGERRGLPQRST